MDSLFAAVLEHAEDEEEGTEGTTTTGFMGKLYHKLVGKKETERTENETTTTTSTANDPEVTTKGTASVTLHKSLSVDPTSSKQQREKPKMLTQQTVPILPLGPQTIMDEEPQFPYFKPLEMESKEDNASSTRHRAVDSIHSNHSMDYDQFRYRPENELSFIDYERDRIKREEASSTAIDSIRISAMLSSESVPNSLPHSVSKHSRRGTTSSSMMSISTRKGDDELIGPCSGSTTAFTANITVEIQSILNEVDDDEDGLLDREQFVDFLSEWTLHQKYTDNDIDIIFKALIEPNDGDSEEPDSEGPGESASCSVFLEKLAAVHRDHPKYSARKAVYRVCQRALKASKQ